MYARQNRDFTRALVAALLVGGPMWTACRDAPVSPPRIVALPTPALVVASTTEDVGLLRALVAQLEQDGALNAGQANALTSKIDAAVRRLDAGNDKTSDNIFGAFTKQVHALVNARAITVRQAQPLLDAVLSLTGNGVQRKALAAGYRFTCALTQTGSAQCWGLNELGQLGDGTTQTRLAPVTVLGELAFRQISGGSDFACALNGEGVAYCWGANASGQLGDASNTDHRSPTAVATTLRFTEITTGAYHACGLTRTGTAYCWGRNDAGPVGDLSWTNRNRPTAVAGGLSFSEIRAGGFHTCGISGSASYCWG
jgi:Regulator of Chromosome Condensation (RCC1) repeat protein/FIMAH domain-containing protein